MAAIPLLIVAMFFVPRLAEHAIRRPAIAVRTAPPVPDLNRRPLALDQSTDDNDDDDTAIDLYGNDVTDAVARYKLDATGSLYEQHSPNTELPHLGSPVS